MSSSLSVPMFLQHPASFQYPKSFSARQKTYSVMCLRFGRSLIPRPPFTPPPATALVMCFLLLSLLLVTPSSPAYHHIHREITLNHKKSRLSLSLIDRRALLQIANLTRFCNSHNRWRHTPLRGTTNTKCREWTATNCASLRTIEKS